MEVDPGPRRPSIPGSLICWGAVNGLARFGESDRVDECGGV